MFGVEYIENKLENVRKAAISVRERMISTNDGDKRTFAKIDKIIRGAVYVKYMHRLAMIFFIVWAIVFLYLMYPDATGMIIPAVGCAIAYAVCFTGILIQIQIYRRTIKKAQAITYHEPGDTVQQSSGVLWQACQNACSENNKKSEFMEK